jgi:SynChlorMet cassette radical SAM/SPASM protein ScmF
MDVCENFWQMVAESQLWNMETNEPDLIAEVRILMEIDKGKIMKLEDVPPLKAIYFHLTEGCNLACRHCWVAPSFDPNGDKKSFLPIELFRLVIEEAKPLGLNSIKLTGGEPLMHPNILSLLEIVRQENISLNIETNGLLCTNEVAAEIAKSNNRSVSVSIDGSNSKTHEWIRGVEGSFEKAKQAVRNLASNGTAPQVIMTLMRRNMDQVEDLINMSEDLGASSVKFNVLQPTARGEGLFETGEALSVIEMIELQKYIEKSLAPNTKLMIHFSTPMAFHPLSDISKGRSVGICNIKNIIGLLADGHYALCGIGVSHPELTFGMAGEDRLERVWRKNVFLKMIRAGLPQKLGGTCGGCAMRECCLGYCLAQNYNSKRDFWSSYWFCEEAEKLGVFPQSRLM